MSFYSIYAILSRIRFCHDLRFFARILRAQICGRVIFLTNIISAASKEPLLIIVFIYVKIIVNIYDNSNIA